MASSRRSQSPRVYVFTITILKVTRIPSPMRMSFRESSALRMMPSRRTLKITVLHGSKQKELGEFEIVQDECLIDQRISCRLFCANDDDLGKLHIYIDQAYCSGLAGHVALDLKEFLEDMDSEVYIKYPLSASSPKEGYVPKLKMTLECTCLGNPENLFIPDLDTIIHHKRRIPSDFLGDNFMEGDTSQALTLLKNQGNDNTSSSSDHCPEFQLLEELESVLFKLDTKLKNFVATCKVEDEKDIPVDNNTVLTKPVAVERGEDCSDCIVCSKGLADKFEGISSGLSSSIDMTLLKSKDVSDAQPEQPKVETKQRPNVLKHLFGGAVLVGLSIFAARSLRKPETPLWQRRRRVQGEVDDE